MVPGHSGSKETKRQTRKPGQQPKKQPECQRRVPRPWYGPIAQPKKARSPPSRYIGRVMPPSGTRTSEYEPQRSRPSLASPSANCMRPVRDMETSPPITSGTLTWMPKHPASVGGRKPRSTSITSEHFYFCRLGRRATRGHWGSLRVRHTHT